MHVIILTGKFGQGHYSASEAIKEKVLISHPTYTVEIIDFISYFFSILSKTIYSSFNFLVNKCCGLYNFFNEIGSRKSHIYAKNILMKKIDTLLKERNCSMIISVFPLCTQYISAYKRMYRSSVILNTCITDIVVHEEWVSKETNYYFVPSKETEACLLEMHVPKEKILITGIPVCSTFSCKKKKNKQKTIVIMGGGLGLFPSIKEDLLSLSSFNLKIYVLVGTNQKIYEELKDIAANVVVVGFTKEVFRYMQEADLLITKAGGITLFEAIEVEVPLLIVKPFLLQEIGNAWYIEEKEIGNVLWDSSLSLKQNILFMLENEEKMHLMRKNMSSIKESFVSVDYILGSKEVC